MSVLGAQPSLLDYLPSLGHLPRVVEILRSSNTAAVRAAVLATHQCTTSQVSAGYTPVHYQSGGCSVLPADGCSGLVTAFIELMAESSNY